MEKFPDYLETMAREAEPAVLAKKGDLFSESSAEWMKDRESYKFECRRFGDFLTVFIERGANPDLNGVVGYYASTPYSDEEKVGAKELEWTDSYEKKSRTSFFKISPEMPYIPKSGRQVFMLDPPPSTQSSGGMMMYSSGGPTRTKFKTDNYVRMAEDDQIRFQGTNASIYVPAGLGQKIYDQIMKEIAKPQP